MQSFFFFHSLFYRNQVLLDQHGPHWTAGNGSQNNFHQVKGDKRDYSGPQCLHWPHGKLYCHPHRAKHITCHRSNQCAKDCHIPFSCKTFHKKTSKPGQKQIAPKVAAAGTRNLYNSSGISGKYWKSHSANQDINENA